jgi:hypothetical protein
MKLFSSESLRRLIARALPEGSEPPPPTPGQLYVPLQHARALNVERALVVGDRGAGKSHWCQSIARDDLRLLVARRMPETGLKDCRVSVGHARGRTEGRFPDEDAFADLLERGYTPREIWQAVIARAVLDAASGLPRTYWRETIDWMRDDRERYSALLSRADAELERSQASQLIVFDALDVIAPTNWDTARDYARELLRLALEFQNRYHALRLKVFLRQDMFSDGAVLAFPDGSKLQNSAVFLEWTHSDLYSLFWQYLANAEQDEAGTFRRECEVLFGVAWNLDQNVWPVPDALRRESVLQEAVFHAVAGPYMGAGKRRGNTYTWLPNHLADGRGYTSPRSFLAALRRAAEHESAKGDAALPYTAIKAGVQAASQIRVKEISEDYDWVEKVMIPLHRLTVPCAFPEIEARWQEKGGVGKLCENTRFLPPSNLREGAIGVRADLEALGVFQVASEQRVNVPDVFRIAFGLGRRGGVKPVGKR